MINEKQEKVSLNLEKTAKTSISETKAPVPIGEPDSIVDKYMANADQTKKTKFAALKESAEINSIATQVFNQMGLVVTDLQGDPLSSTNLLKRVNMYLTRFPEIEYLIDMISSSVIYSSSSNTKKIQFVLNGEYKTIEKQKKAKNADGTATDTSTGQPVIEIEEVNVDVVDKVDSWYQELNLEVGNLFKKNNIKLSLYHLMSSMTKYGCGIFYVDDPKKQEVVSFYSLDEVDFKVDDKEVHTNALINEFNNTHSQIFEASDENDEIKTIKAKKVTAVVTEDGEELKTKNMYFISEKGTLGKSEVVKVIHYLKIIELLELSLLIERISKTRTTHVWKLDLSKVEDEDIAATMMLYRNLLKNQLALNYDEDEDNVQMDIVKNLVDNNILVPTDDKNLDIQSLKSEFKPLLDDVNYYWDKIYLSLGIPLHYRKGSESKAYVNNNMLIMHDNVYAMKIRHYQLIINNLLTFWIENWLKANHKGLTIKYLNINIPEFIPISERKETDLDKATKFVTMFTQLEQMLGIKIKQDFLLNKLFPNDIMSDIVDVAEEEEVAEDIEEMEEEETEEDIVSLFESGNFLQSKNTGRDLFKMYNVRKYGQISVYKYNLKLNIDW